MTDQPIDEQLLNAARTLFPDATTVQAVQGHPHLVRVETPSGEWRVRRWVEDVAVDRIRFVHDLLDTCAAAGLTVVPRLHRTEDGTIFRLDDNVFDATTWIPGRPAGRYRPEPARGIESVHVPASISPTMHEELTSRVAEFHEATRTLVNQPDAPRVTLQGVDRAVRAAWQAYRDRLRPVAPRRPHVQRWLRTAERALPAAGRALADASPAVQGRRVVGHFDLWPAHVILQRSDGDEHVGGLIDFSESAVGSPLLDLAQLATRFTGWSEETAELVTAAYSRSAALTPEDRRLLPAIAVLDLTAELGRLLTLIYTGREAETLPAPRPLRDGAEAMLVSLEIATNMLLRLESPDRGPRRRWVPGRRRPGRPSPPPSRRNRPRRDR